MRTFFFLLTHNHSLYIIKYTNEIEIESEGDNTVNRQHKDRLFRSLFGDEKRKKNTLELYNALNGTDYYNEKDLELVTLDDVIYMGMKNDVAFLIYDDMSMFEQQSTFNPNMPIRGLMYGVRLYSKYIEQKKLNVYGTKLINCLRLSIMYYIMEKRSRQMLLN